MSLALILNAPIKTEFREAEDFPMASTSDQSADDILDKVEKLLIGTIGDAIIVLDATKTENHRMTTEIPSNTIQIVNENKEINSVAIHDHVYLQPRKLTITGVISDSPWGRNDRPRRCVRCGRKIPSRRAGWERSKAAGRR